MMGFSQRLQRIMNAKGIKPRDLVRMCDGVSIAWVYKALSGEIENVGVEKVNAVAKALEVPATALLGDDFGSAMMHDYVKEPAPKYNKLDKLTRDLMNAIDEMTDEEKKKALKFFKDYILTEDHSVKTQKKIS